MPPAALADPPPAPAVSGCGGTPRLDPRELNEPTDGRATLADVTRETYVRLADTTDGELQDALIARLPAEMP